MTYWAGDNVLSVDIGQTDRTIGKQTALVHAFSSSNETTLLSVHNYWSWSYGLQAVRMTVELRGSDGVCLVDRELEISPDGCVCVDVREWLAPLGVSRFEGVAFFKVEAEGLNPENPIQLVADYLSGSERNRSISSVHGQGAETAYPFSQRMHMVCVQETERWATWFALLGHYTGKESLPTKSVEVQLFNASGDCMTTEIPLPPFGGVTTHRVSEIFRNATEHLAGLAGHLKVTAPFKMHRLFYATEHRQSESVSVNHATVDHNHNYPEWSGIPAPHYKELGCYPTVVAPIVHAPGLSSGVFLSNTTGPPSETRTFCIDVYPAEGSEKPMVRREVTLTPGECLNLDISNWLGVRDFFGQAVAWIPWTEQTDAFPRQIDWLPFIRSIRVQLDSNVGNRRVMMASSHVGSAVYNVQTKNDYFRPLGTRIFSRMHCGPDVRSELILTYPTSGQNSQKYSDTDVTVCRADGKSVVHAFKVPRNGCCRLDLCEEFEDVAALLKGETSYTVRCQDKQVRLVGFHLTRVRGGAGIAMDHLFGG